jgi:hypothetical protein
MVLYYLVHVKQPPVLPNLQRIAPLRPLAEHEVMIQGRNVYFFDDTETLRQEWSSINFETVGELCVGTNSSRPALVVQSLSSSEGSVQCGCNRIQAQAD